jgi:hypothetical protein
VKKVKKLPPPEEKPQPQKLVEPAPAAKAKPHADLPPVSLKKGAGGAPLDMDFFGRSNKGAGMAAAFKEFDDLEDAQEEKKEDTRSFQEVLKERREKAEKDLQSA